MIENEPVRQFRTAFLLSYLRKYQKLGANCKTQEYWNQNSNAEQTLFLPTVKVKKM